MQRYEGWGQDISAAKKLQGQSVHPQRLLEYSAQGSLFIMLP